MMMVERFNATLQKYSHNLATLHMLRAGLSTIAPEALLSYLAEIDGGQKGYFTGEEIVAVWMKAIPQDEQSLRAFIRRSFPFTNISYSTIQHFLTQGRSPPPNISQPQQSLHETAETAVIERDILDRLQSFVPMKYSRPTEEELSSYVICQEIAVDVRAVSQRLNLLQNNGSQNESLEIEYEKSLANSSLASIQDVVKRIQARASSLGRQWLSERGGRE